jgi:predicted nucleotidyltransferase
VFAELSGLVAKTTGIPARIRAALAPLSDRILAAAVFGSVAKGTDSAQSDVDVLVLSDQITHAELFEALQTAERDLGRPVNPTLMEPQAWRTRLQVRDSFVQRATAGPMLPMIGSVADVG